MGHVVTYKANEYLRQLRSAKEYMELLKSDLVNQGYTYNMTSDCWEKTENRNEQSADAAKPERGGAGELRGTMEGGSPAGGGS